MDFSASQIATAGFIGQGFGALSGAFGSYYGAEVAQINTQTQAQAIRHQAAMDVYNARSSALTLTGQADLDWVSAQAQRNATLTGAEFSVLSAQAQADQSMARAQIAQVEAGGRAAALEYSAQADELQARLSELQAQSSLLQGERREQGTRLQYAQAKSKATASMGARGIDLGQGSALAVRNSIDLMSERDAIAIQQDTLMAAFGHRTQAMQAQLSAQGKRAQAGATVAAAASQVGLAKTEANYSTSMARINADATVALSAAGLVSTQATGDYQRAVAGIMVNNASAASLVRGSMAPTYTGASGSSAAFGSLLGSSSSMFNSWYAWKKEN